MIDSRLDRKAVTIGATGHVLSIDRIQPRYSNPDISALQFHLNAPLLHAYSPLRSLDLSFNKYQIFRFYLDAYLLELSKSNELHIGIGACGTWKVDEDLPPMSKCNLLRMLII